MARISVSSEAELVDVVRAARETRRTMEIVGHGTKRGLGRPIECDDVLDLSGLSGIVKYEPDEMVITAQAGTPVAELEAALAEKNQRVGFEPADWGPLYGAPSNSATIGGVLAADASGSAAIRYGRCRDHLLGYRAVNGFGEAYKAGGRVVKNVTGFDLPKLMCGAMGTLGPMTEVTLRAFPIAGRAHRFAVRGVEDADGFDLLRRIASSSLDATGLAFRHRNHELGDALIRLEGSSAALTEKTMMLRALVRGELVEDDGGMFADIAYGRLPDRLAKRDILDIWRVALLPSRAADFPPFGQNWVSDWSGARRWVLTTPGLVRADVNRTLACVQGRATLIRASEATRRLAQIFAPETPELAALTKRVKAAFDPLKLFNPGRMWDGV
jgi:glycolate oxidase FAD binding subunit